ncbi:hypothetical protein D3P07_00500 [Paenibacillus sp. 1011MAR3C5]|uniref:hypothetical protein n=1 Tax=Paenibacillus sp. 1011MAR3C5 TaxID=1675787 RepID=UPI000E6D1FB2|nr:hypothetical protein [Paenibacillus sp. 1011MAR3C5]RJE90623.1 hypothetical protein D3P07_00500 [Paenibacillus sp. 1011MAR3C5]
MRTRLPFILISLFLLSIVLLTGCSKDDEFHNKLRLLDREMVESKLLQEGFSFEEKDLFDIYRLDVEGLRTQTAFELAGNESSLYMYIFESEEEQFQGRKQLERQTIALSYKPTFYDVNNVLLVYMAGYPEEPYNEQIDELARNLLKK